MRCAHRNIISGLYTIILCLIHEVSAISVGPVGCFRENLAMIEVRKINLK